MMTYDKTKCLCNMTRVTNQIMTRGNLGCDDILTCDNVRDHTFMTHVIDMWMEVPMDEKA